MNIEIGQDAAAHAVLRSSKAFFLVDLCTEMYLEWEDKLENILESNEKNRSF